MGISIKPCPDCVYSGLWSQSFLDGRPSHLSSPCNLSLLAATEIDEFAPAAHSVVMMIVENKLRKHDL